MPSTHAPFSPSSMKRKALCPASHTAEQGYPDTSSPASIEGTHVHTLNEVAAKASTRASNYIGTELEDHEGKFTVAAEMAELSQVFLDFVNRYKAENNDVNPFYWEIRYELTVYPGQFLFRDDWYGTADLVLIQYQHYDPLKVPVQIIVADYKNGSMPVDAYENYQGLSYMLGVLASIHTEIPKDTPVIFFIIQPKCEKPKRFETTVRKLLTIYLEKLANVIQACLAPNPEFAPGDEQCQFCKHKRNCEARKNMALETAAMAFSSNPTKVPAPAPTTAPTTNPSQDIQLSPQLPVIGQMTNEQLAQVLMATPIVKGWLKDAYDEAFERHQAGNLIPNHKLIQKSGRRSWIDNPELIIKTLTKGFTYEKRPIWGKRDIVTETPISFTKILANPKLTDKQRERIESELIKKPQGKQELVPVSSKGQDVTPATAFAGANIS